MWLCLADENFPLHGLIKRTQLLRMLKHRIGMFAHDGMSPLPPSRSRIPKTQVCYCSLLVVTLHVQVHTPAGNFLQ